MINPGYRAENVYIILVEPIYEGNVGAVARIMNNFCFANLRIVGALPTKNDFYLAMHSTFILENAQVFDNLEAATADLDRVIAFSRRVGKLKPIDFDPKTMAQYASEVKDLKLGLVFGRETFGLTDAEADLCPLRCHIGKSGLSFHQSGPGCSHRLLGDFRSEGTAKSRSGGAFGASADGISASLYDGCDGKQRLFPGS